jgi:hypothetical protein
MDAAVNNSGKQRRGRPFRPGQSGNPRGRPAGARNRRTLDAITAAEAEGELPLEFLLRTMRDPKVDLPTRLDVAKAAMPYLHARIAPTQVALVPGDDAKLVNGPANGAPPAPSPLALELQAWQDELTRVRAERNSRAKLNASGAKASDND